MRASSRAYPTDSRSTASAGFIVPAWAASGFCLLMAGASASSDGRSKLSISPSVVRICEPCCAARTPRFTRCGLRCRAIRTLGTSCAGGDSGGALISGCGGTAKSHLIAPRSMCCRRKDEGMFRLYYAPDTCALATHIALEEAGAPYEAVLVDFRSQAQRSPEYLAVNPKGRVPALVIENGTLTETPALLCFVAQRFPNAELAPLADPFALAQVQEFNSYLCSTVHVAHAHRMRGTRWADDAAAMEAMKRKVPSNVTECFELIEHKLFRGPWVMGEQYTICDPYLFTIASWIEGDGVDTAKVPRVMEHRGRMLTRPAVQKAVAAEGTQIP